MHWAQCQQLVSLRLRFRLHATDSMFLICLSPAGWSQVMGKNKGTKSPHNPVACPGHQSQLSEQLRSCSVVRNSTRTLHHLELWWMHRLKPRYFWSEAMPWAGSTVTKVNVNFEFFLYLDLDFIYIFCSKPQYPVCAIEQNKIQIFSNQKVDVINLFYAQVFNTTQAIGIYTFYSPFKIILHISNQSEPKGSGTWIRGQRSWPMRDPIRVSLRLGFRPVNTICAWILVTLQCIVAWTRFSSTHRMW